MNQNNPLSVALADNLTNYNIQNESFRLGNVSIEGDKYICVKENVNDNTQVVVINLHNKTNSRKYMKAESVIIHPNDPILALRGTIKNVNTVFLQVFNIETKEKICSLNLNEYMNYWKWINNDTIVIVCEKNVYHWNIDIHNSKKNKDNNNLVKIFEKAQVFIDNNSQILYYATDKEMKWCILCGISTQDQGKSIDGYMQLYSCEKKLHQTIEGFIGCFGSFIFDNWDMKPLFCFIEKKKNSNISRLHLMDIYSNKTEGNIPYKVVKEINLVNENLNDFPIYINMNTLQGLIYVVTKCSYVYIFDEGTLSLIIKEKISEDNIFICCESKNGEGIYAVNKKGKIYYITINYLHLINYLKLSNIEFKDKIIKNLCYKYGYPGCDYISAYKKCINEMDFKKASKIICLMKNPKIYEEYSNSISEAILIMNKKNVDIRIIPPLRTQQVLNSFKSFKNTSGQLSPLLLYFSVLLEYDKLNSYESIELVKPVVLQKKKEYLEKWIKDDKLTYSEELGDLVKVLDLRLALNIYLRCDSHNKIVSTYCLLNMFNNVLSYTNNFKQFNFDYVNIFIDIINYDFSSVNDKDASSSGDLSNSSKNETMDFFNDSGNSNDNKLNKSSNSEIAVHYIKFLCENNIQFDINSIVDYLLSKKRLQEATSLLLDYLKDNKPEHKNLQTKLFEFNLYNNVQVAETLFQMDIFTYYDKNKIAYLCEEKGLYQRALENYTNLNDIKRVINKSTCFQKNGSINNTFDNNNTSINKGISLEWIKNYFSTLSDTVCQDILFDLMKGNKVNMDVIISICVQYYNKIGIKKIINKFEENKNYEGIFYFVSSILNELPNLTNNSNDDLSSNNNTLSYNNINDVNSSILLTSEITTPYKQTNYNLKVEDVHYIMFKYIEACVKINNIQELDRICKDKNAKYNPEQIKNFLKECKLSDPRPLIYVCDIHNYIEELAEYLYRNSLLKYIEVYVLKVNPNNAHKVIGVLLDLDASEDFLLNILNNIKNISNIGNLIEIAEKRNRLKLLLPWLESRANEGYENIELHNALAKIYIDLNKDPENFLKNNNFYDKKMIGKYCEDLDPHLAYTAYERSNGECDEELINITSKNGLFKLQARYLVSRQSIELWKIVLDESNKYRKNVIDQVIGSTLIESNNAEEITVTVKAFIEKKLSSELIELLEKIVLHNSEFSDNKNLQNLLILTAIKSDSDKVMEYINRLDNFSGPQIASIAYDYKLREEAFVIYKKFNCYTSAISVLLDSILYDNIKNRNINELSNDTSSYNNNKENMFLRKNDNDNDNDEYLNHFAEYDYRDKNENYSNNELISKNNINFDQSNDNKLPSDTFNNYDDDEENKSTFNVTNYEDDLNRAIEFAQKCNNSDVWFILGKAQLKLNKIIDAIDSFVKSNNPEAYKEVIEKCIQNNYYEHLITYLNTLREQNSLKDVLVDSELLYAYAKLKKTTEMTKFINSTNSANLQLIGDRLYKEQEYEVAKILYSNIPNNQKLTICYLRLKEYSLAIEAAKKAKSLKTWKEVNFICVKEKQLKYAHTAGLQLIMHADHLDEIIKIYEKKKYINELMSLLENGLNNERAHVGIYTELGILYAKYKPEKLMEFIRNYANKINTRKLIDVCQNEYLLKEAVYLYISYDEYNLAVDTIIKHSPTAYTPDTFMQVIHKVTNSDIIHKVIDFYIEEHPLSLYNLLKILENKIDNNRLVQTLKKSNNLPLIQKYLEDIQAQNITAVNETLNEIYLQNDDYISLRNSIDEYDNFNQMNLINKLENHKLPEMRRIASLLYKKNKKYKEAINLSKKEEQYKDAIEIARVSKNNTYIEDLINYFIEINNKEAFCACLIVCYDLLKPDYILEIIWSSGFTDQAMLYFIQIVSDYTNQIDIMKKQIEDMQKEKKMNKSAPNDYSATSISNQFNYSLNNNLSIMPPQNNYMSNNSQFDKYDMFNNNTNF
ncbi:clathrin heavy chain, putative [Plasmodium gallinaceum]|uniref:Clathrin heavy chain n=1 Tax=Plasmodium gallinaceum TaxID=5849 RepID=A0A1J1GZP7_PLAGA|nr:clathrin heavy chain, putative [Plasmodium gallinaceum]CRG97759.1 clathrin heavy chain, putative [Plasmodium gallinaceum]